MKRFQRAAGAVVGSAVHARGDEHGQALEERQEGQVDPAGGVRGDVTAAADLLQQSLRRGEGPVVGSRKDILARASLFGRCISRPARSSSRPALRCVATGGEGRRPGVAAS
ncbi:hypothetical protein GCM10010287_21440 [Streptomyces variabilis]|uniref:Uncharacterized protein n=1 Tax=Streptomyces variabilis TaxID=67372 RepID=A0ABQ2TYP4_9ACTN|nr:hypothetical protein GCM10010265_01060 [Streptomyces griseoincarnatus]GGT47571.1 hypothetical protein GCM10010287_21440 [Streptomyces variabilis]